MNRDIQFYLFLGGFCFLKWNSKISRKPFLEYFLTWLKCKYNKLVPWKAASRGTVSTLATVTTSRATSTLAAISSPLTCTSSPLSLRLLEDQLPASADSEHAAPTVGFRLTTVSNRASEASLLPTSSSSSSSFSSWSFLSDHCRDPLDPLHTPSPSSGKFIIIKMI